MPDTEHRSAVCTFNTEPSLKAEFYRGCKARGLSATFLFRRLMQNKVTEFKLEDAEEDTQETAA